jgi:pimeloyl-ACP methyl ester carboxylesterase
VTTRGLGREVVGLLEALDLVEPVLMLGLGSGGGVLQWVCLDEPEAVRAAALVASSPGQFDERVVPRHLDIETVASLAEQGWPGFLERHLSGRELFFDVAPDALEAFLAAHRGEFATELRSYLAHLEAALQHETTAHLAEIEVPALVLVGDHDDVAPEGAPCRIESSLALASRLFYSEYVEIEDAALGLHVERPDAFNEVVLDFLVRH